MRVNTLPKISWNKVGANDAELVLEPIDRAEFAGGQMDEIPSSFDGAFKDTTFGISKEVLEENLENRNLQRFIELSADERLEYTYKLDEEHPKLLDLQAIHVKSGANALLTFDYSSNEEVEAYRNSLIKIRAERDSKLKLVLIQRFSNISKSLLSIVSELEDNAEVKLVVIEMGSMDSMVNYVSNLRGYGAKSDLDSAYFVDGDRKLDINYVMNHIGQAGLSNMMINGALKDRAKKRFAGTLDFKKGSAGSNGNEEEYVTLMDEKVLNIAVPLLLAHEHDIQGNHAASAGRIDEDMLYYIMSRGLSEKEAKTIVVEARITPALDMIDNKILREELKELLHKGLNQ